MNYCLVADRFRSSVHWLLIFTFLWLLASCRSDPTPPPPQIQSGPIEDDSATGSCSLDLATDVSDEEAIRAVLTAESEYLIQQDIEQIMNLWSGDSHVIDAKNTPDDETDDQVWNGKDAIRHRYVRTVFPGAPANAEPTDLDIVIQDGRADVRATTQIGAEVSPAGDRWTLVKRNQCWLLESLTYNLEPPN